MTVFSEALAAHVAELKQQNQRLRERLYAERRRSEMWRVRALNRSTTAGTRNSFEGRARVPAGRTL